jgi:carboxymethylenebutenolidase
LTPVYVIQIVPRPAARVNARRRSGWVGWPAVKLFEERVRVPSPAGEIRTVVIRPAGAAPLPGLLLYTDIFQLTESSLRTARRFASAGLVVAVPEIYPHGDLAGVALEFDDEGKAAGAAGAAATGTAQFDADRVAVLDHLAQRPDVTELNATGFCIGGHLAFRAALDPRVRATVCFYPTGLHDGNLGADDPGSLARAGEIEGRLMIVFGSQDPHVPPGARTQIVSALYAAGHTDLELHVYRGGEHAFMRDVGARFDPLLTDLALAEALSFLAAR